MFWSKKKNNDKDKRKKSGVGTGLQTVDGGHTCKSQKLREEALANARAARAHIGEDTLDKIAAAMAKKQQNAQEQAKQKIKTCESDRVAAEILAMMDDER